MNPDGFVVRFCERVGGPASLKKDEPDVESFVDWRKTQQVRREHLEALVPRSEAAAQSARPAAAPAEPPSTREALEEPKPRVGRSHRSPAESIVARLERGF